MKKLFFLALFLLLASGAADARTLYVDVSRPNNNGNGLKPATAKRTIQAAINIAKAGDTILVYPGNYAPIATNNKKITIKSVKGASRTKIVHPRNAYWGTLASLGGQNTLLTGFLLDGRKDDGLGVWGGMLKACILQRVYCGSSGSALVDGATLTDCTLRGNGSITPIENCILNRCMFMDNSFPIHGSRLNRCTFMDNFCTFDGSVLNRCTFMDNSCTFEGSRLCNCLVVGNANWGWDYRDGGKRHINPSLFESSTLVNCTIAKNLTWHEPDHKPVFAYKSRFFNCILRNNCSRAETGNGKTAIHNADTAKVYQNTYSHTYTDNRNPTFADAANNNFRLAKGSPCIDRGVINATLREWLGTLDLRGRQRVKGKAIDMGCYEY
jgi:hypothetical protein